MSVSPPLVSEHLKTRGGKNLRILWVDGQKLIRVCRVTLPIDFTPAKQGTPYGAARESLRTLARSVPGISAHRSAPAWANPWANILKTP